jgi:hypothetical protein
VVTVERPNALVADGANPRADWERAARVMIESESFMIDILMFLLVYCDYMTRLKYKYELRKQVESEERRRKTLHEVLIHDKKQQQGEETRRRRNSNKKARGDK